MSVYARGWLGHAEGRRRRRRSSSTGPPLPPTLPTRMQDALLKELPMDYNKEDNSFLNPAFVVYGKRKAQ